MQLVVHLVYDLLFPYSFFLIVPCFSSKAVRMCALCNNIITGVYMKSPYRRTHYIPNDIKLILIITRHSHGGTHCAFRANLLYAFIQLSSSVPFLAVVEAGSSILQMSLKEIVRACCTLQEQFCSLLTKLPRYLGSLTGFLAMLTKRKALASIASTLSPHLP